MPVSIYFRSAKKDYRHDASLCMTVWQEITKKKAIKRKENVKWQDPFWDDAVYFK